MPWNPQDSNPDPWGRNKNNPQGPPDLDALLQQLKAKIQKIFGGNSKGTNGSSREVNHHVGLMLIFGVVFLIWVLSGIFIVSPPERAVVLRFGKYVNTLGPGPHWIPALFESKQIVDIQRVANFSYESDMLTKDENIVTVTVAVQYRIQDAKEYLFNVVEPNRSIEQATASALRQVVGRNTLDDLLTTGRQKVREDVALQLQQLINSYNTGLVVTDVTLQSVKPPEEVTAAFDDAIKAREDQQSYINKADAYAKQVSAAAEGQAARVIQEAEAYKKQVVLEAQANTANFLALLPEYQKSPETLRQRLYLNTMQTVLSNSSKVFLDQKSSNPLVYLPLDRLTPFVNRKIEISPIATATKSAVSTTDTTTDLNAANRASYPMGGDSR